MQKNSIFSDGLCFMLVRRLSLHDQLWIYVIWKQQSKLVLRVLAFVDLFLKFLNSINSRPGPI